MKERETGREGRRDRVNREILLLSDTERDELKILALDLCALNVFLRWPLRKDLSIYMTKKKFVEIENMKCC